MRLINRWLRFICGGGTHKKEGLNSITDNPYKVGFSFVLDSSAMAQFKEEALKLPFRYLDLKNKLMYITSPDDNDRVSFELIFPSYTMDKYCYFYPQSDFKYYIPKGYTPGIKLELKNVDEKKEVDPKKLLDFISVIENDIKKQLRPDKFRYWVADKREERYADKEWSSGCSIYSDELELVGKVHTFCGNATFTGHEDYDKADCARVTLYGSPDNEVYFIDLKSLESDAPVSCKKGIVFLRKEPVDYIRLEFCEFVRFMCQFGMAKNGQLFIYLW